MRLATLLVRDQAEAEQVVRDMLASSPPQVRDVGAEQRAVVNRCAARSSASAGDYRRTDG